MSIDLFEFFGIFDDVGDVDEAIFPFIDIDEGRLDIVEDFVTRPL